LKDFNYSSIDKVTDIEKIVLNSGVGQAISEQKFLDNTEKALIQIANGQKVVITKARKSVTT
jgi:large subunit ribosomal protein L5